MAPGAFRTEGIYGGTYFQENNIPANDALRNASIERFYSISGTEPGNPDKAMELLVDVVRGEGKAGEREFPQYLILGEDAMANAEYRAGKVVQACRDWEDLAGKPLHVDSV